MSQRKAITKRVVLALVVSVAVFIAIVPYWYSVMCDLPGGCEVQDYSSITGISWPTTAVDQPWPELVSASVACASGAFVVACLRRRPKTHPG